MSRKNTGRLLRTLTAAAFLTMTALGLAMNTGWGTLSSFGIDAVSQICPLGAFEAMLADKTFIPQAVIALLVVAAVVALLGRVFCGWICPVPLLRRMTGMRDVKPAETVGGESVATSPCTKDKCSTCGACEALKSKVAKQGTSGAKPNAGPFLVLGGALASSAVFGFPVFCLICPVGLTFALMIALWRLFEFNEPTWSIALFAAFLILELFVLRRWCHQFCPLGAVMTIFARMNQTFRARVKTDVCATSAGIDCRVCRDACPEGLDPRGGNDVWRDARCTKCRACADACPTHAIHFPFYEKKLAMCVAKDEGMEVNKRTERTVVTAPRTPEKVRPAAERLGDFGEAVISLTRGEAQIEADRCLRCGECVAVCPLHNPIPDMMRLMAEGRAAEAGRLLLENGATPDLCGRLCPQERLCEKACSIGRVGMPVAIGAVERAAADAALARGGRLEKGRTRVKAKVAVVGAGPAGLACADQLVRLGASVTLIDEHAETGGLLTHGVPGFKLDAKAVQLRTSMLAKAKVDMKLGVKAGEALPYATLVNDYDAIFLAIGAADPVMPAFAFRVTSGLVDALQFLSDFGRGKSQADLLGREVWVLGGGDTAVDCVRTLRRLGAKAVMACRRPKDELRASKHDTRLALEEGVEIRDLVTADDVVTDREGRLTGLKLRRVDTSEVIEVPAAMVIVAYGERAVKVDELAALGVLYDEEHRIQVDADGHTAHAKIWAGGDAVRGPALVVNAVADGRTAARSIAKTLGL